ncbi:unannotated protein [freshwater metagenome]|uniref:Unannotated protein n=1 Tax=freshwater metagenome TaxID=449393 RepID=A0A6J7E871_9ZZZZ|nr:hypothetical protein [Actinomycetota bacterium]
MTMPTEPDRVERMICHDDIRQLAARYCWALDTLDRALLADVFTADATASLGRGTQHGFDEIWSWIHGVLAHLDTSQHLIGSQLIDLADDGRSATSRCHFTAQHVRRSAGKDTQYIVAGRYDDRLVLADAGWRIEHRTLRVLWTSGNPDVISPPA